MLLSEELALVGIQPESGRHALGMRAKLNACLAGLLVAELMLEGAVAPGDNDNSIVARGTAPEGSAALAAALRVVEDKGPKIKAVLSHMDRGLQHELGTGTWDTAVAGLIDAGLVGPAKSSLRPHHALLDPAARDAIVTRLQEAAAGDEALEPRTAVLLSVAGPAQLLELVAPERRNRRHARERIDHALDQTDLKGVGKMIRKVIAEAEAAAAASTAVVIAGSS